jgi:hypothetical protein
MTPQFLSSIPFLSSHRTAGCGVVDHRAHPISSQFCCPQQHLQYARHNMTVSVIKDSTSSMSVRRYPTNDSTFSVQRCCACLVLVAIVSSSPCSGSLASQASFAPKRERVPLPTSSIPASETTTRSLTSINPSREETLYRFLVRGGQSAYSNENAYPNNNDDNSNNNYVEYNNNNNNNNMDGSYPQEPQPNYIPPPASDGFGVSEDPFHETVQDRVEAWRQAQLQRSGNLSPLQKDSHLDDQGRVKLLASVSKGSRAFLFFIMMWRDVHLYEVADQSLKGIVRLMAVVPLILLFVANMAGVAASLSSPTHSAKKRLKAILNLDKLMEAILLVWYFIRLTVAPPKYVSREILIANTMHSVFFILQCQGFTRLVW